MDYTNYTNASYREPSFIPNSMTQNPSAVRTVEPNRSDTESTEQRLYGAYRNNDTTIRDLTPDSTPDAPLIYPISNEYNASIANELNNQTMSSQQPTMPSNNTNTYRNSATMPMPSFTTATRTRNTPTPELYTPLGDKTSPASYTNPNYSMQPGYSMNSGYSMQPGYSMNSGYSNLTTNYQMDASRNMYLPARNTPYYNLSSEGNESINDFDAAERDMEYLRELYPVAWRLLEREIDEECDKLEYEGSFMFDEYPDKVTLDRCIQRIYNRIKDRDEFKQYNSLYDQGTVTTTQINYYPCPGCNWLEDLTRIMFINQIGNRRRRYRSRRRWFF